MAAQQRTEAPMPNAESSIQSPPRMRPLTTTEEFEAVRRAALAVVYKHSGRCPISLLAYDEVEQLAEEQGAVPVYVIDVNEDRALSRHVASALGITHHSPQAIVLARGRPVWHGSHFEVRVPVLTRVLQEQSPDEA
jgi:bacillithiol system protein YtxJ